MCDYIYIYIFIERERDYSTRASQQIKNIHKSGTYEYQLLFLTFKLFHNSLKMFYLKIWNFNHFNFNSLIKL